MNRPTISRCTVRDIEHAEGLDAVLAEYAAECAIAGLGNANPQFERYHMLEDAGVLYVIGAFNGDALVGFAAILVAPLTHFDCISATTESFFVVSSERRSGMGLALLREAELLAQEHGAVGLFVSAPTGGRLDAILPRSGYTETNRVFFRGLR